MTGSLGPILFQFLRSPSRLDRRRRAGVARHEVAGGVTRLEVVGRDADQVSVEIRLVAATGLVAGDLTPEDDVAALAAAMQGGEALALFVGTELWGHFLIEDLTERYRHLAPSGVVRSVDLRLGLIEYVQDGAGVVATAEVAA